MPAFTQQQQYDVSTLAALAWVWMSYTDDPEPVAQASVMRSFQQQYNARMPTLRAIQSAGETMPHPLRMLSVDGQYGPEVAKAIYNVSALAVSGSTSAFASLPTRYDRGMIGVIWDDVQRMYPVSTSSQAGRTMWAMLRALIGTPPEQAGQAAVNAAYHLWNNSAPPSSYTSLVPLVKAGSQTTLEMADAGPGEAFITTERDFSTEPALVVGRTQRRTASLAWLGVLAVAGVGIVTASAYKGSR